MADPFCPLCGVSLDLHPYGEIDVHDPEAWECEVAGRKADLLDRFGGLIRG